ncbi:hypothetical protein BS101_18855 [Clostridium kluyveri]|uniref:NADPH-dependent FMN reductase-like domain-containing protein n=1 Tax=Clostridium kluyveri TaxID=1534 RepID=A0A1L5FC99_CLOKL|nr:hypothetical protein BS101_18855 [Clostridium kluyveri]
MKTLEKEKIEAEIFHIGNKPIIGCTACNNCFKTKSGKCIFNDDTVNVALEKAEKADGFIFGSPVHYASDLITSFLECIQAERKAGILLPEKEPMAVTNFIR